MLLIVIIVGIITNNANAQMKNSLGYYSPVYDLFQYVELYSTVPQKEVELSYRFEHIVYGSEHGTNHFPNQWGHRVGGEFGITQKLMVEIFTNFQQPEANTGNLSLANLSLALRYRILEHNKFFVDPAVMIEYKKGFSGRGSGIEGKIILSKEIGRFIFIGNFGVESSGVEAGGSNKLGFEFGFNGGAGYKITNWLAIGGEYEHEFLGPTIGTLYKKFRLNFSVGSSVEGATEQISSGKIQTYI